MSMIQIEDLTFSFPSGGDLFDHASFQIDTSWRLGLVGRNGRGKTTFLRLLLGELAYRGWITASVALDCFPYPVPDQSRTTEEVLQAICPQAELWALTRELSFLEMNDSVLQRPFATLSNGEQTKALLAALFLNEGRFLLIDEPTNHLDARGRALLAAYLNRKKGFLLVSHDRSVLDGCVDHILSFNRADIQVQSGNFSSWMENFERQQDFEEAQNQRLQRDIGRLQQAARQASAWSGRTEASKYGNGPVDRGYVGHKAAKMMKRSKSIEARRQQAVQQKAQLLQNTETAERLKLSPTPYHGAVLAACTGTAVYYDGKAACAPVSFTVRQGDRLVIDGRNGSGKSSLLKLLLGEPPAHTGTVSMGSGVTVSYVPQDTSQLRGTLAQLAADSQIDESQLKTILRKMNFERAQLEQPMESFSGGQKKKVLLAKSLCERAHLYLWDEPLNFIDVYSRIQIERLIQEFSPTMVFVEHDRAFREAIATKTVRLEPA